MNEDFRDILALLLEQEALLATQFAIEFSPKSVAGPLRPLEAEQLV